MQEEQLKEVEEEFKKIMDEVPHPDSIQMHQKFTDRDMINYWEDVLEPKIMSFWFPKLQQAYKQGAENNKEKVIKMLKEYKDKGFELETAIYHLEAGVY